MAEHIDVMISSTARDLPDHREKVMHACLRQSMHPIMMEHLPTNDADAIATSLKMVDDAEVYLGIFAHRYGYTPKGYDISITEMEYNRAVERKIPRLIFMMDKLHPINVDQIEMGDGAEKLRKFKERLQTDQVVNFFNSPDELQALAINSLSQYRPRDVIEFHYISDIPKAPEAYIAHPYTLLQTGALIGRQPELNLLTDWVARPTADVYSARIFNIVAIGGMGKSALTWKWFNDVAPQEMKPMAGQMWWSFYESDASFENFVTRALAYMTGKRRDDVEKISISERETQLLAILDHEPFLLVLDGLERILIAYARMDAARLADDDLDERTANIVTALSGLPDSAAQSFIGQHKLRKTADPRVGNFLRKLASVQSARILVSTRLYPADLQMITGDPTVGSFAYFLPGLTDDDALNLWWAYGVSGVREMLVPLFHSFDNYPLLIRALAGEVAKYRRAPGDFDQWRKANPHFSPFKLDMKQAKSHVLQFALQGLNDTARKVLYTIAAFRMPATYDTLAALLVGDDKPIKDEDELDAILTELEDRGLVGWDKRANRYDLHPIVRGVTWSTLDENAKHGVYEALHGYFEAVPKIDDWHKVNNLEDLTPAIELYNTLIGLGRCDEASDLFHARLGDAILYRLGASKVLEELIETLFLDGLHTHPKLSNPDAQASAINVLGLAYQSLGQPGKAASVLKYKNESIDRPNRNFKNLAAGLCNLSETLRHAGSLRGAEYAAWEAAQIADHERNRWRQAHGLQLVGITAATRGMSKRSQKYLQNALDLFQKKDRVQAQGTTYFYLAQTAFWFGRNGEARKNANTAWELANYERRERDFIRAARLQGAIALRMGSWVEADERLHHALTRARAVNHVEEELPTLALLAELHRQQGKPREARDSLDDVWEAAERGPYPLFHADALNVLAQIERDAANHEAAVKIAAEAYRTAWCDGISADGRRCFAYWWGLQGAKAHLQALGEPAPVLPPFDESKFVPEPGVEIDLGDEFPEGSL